MWINELTEAECEAVLERATIARLATCLDDRPYVVPISIKFERDGAARTSFSDLYTPVVYRIRIAPELLVQLSDVSVVEDARDGHTHARNIQIPPSGTPP